MRRKATSGFSLITQEQTLIRMAMDGAGLTHGKRASCHGSWRKYVLCQRRLLDWVGIRRSVVDGRGQMYQLNTAPSCSQLGALSFHDTDLPQNSEHAIGG